MQVGGWGPLVDITSNKFSFDKISRSTRDCVRGSWRRRQPNLPVLGSSSVKNKMKKNRTYFVRFLEKK